MTGFPKREERCAENSSQETGRQGRFHTSSGRLTDSHSQTALLSSNRTPKSSITQLAADSECTWAREILRSQSAVPERVLYCLGRRPYRLDWSKWIRQIDTAGNSGGADRSG